MVLTSSILPPAATAASAFFIITGDTVVASAAPPAIRLEFLKKVRRLIAPGTDLQGLAAFDLSILDDDLINFFMCFPPRLNAS